MVFFMLEVSVILMNFNKLQKILELEKKIVNKYLAVKLNSSNQFVIEIYQVAQHRLKRELKLRKELTRELKEEIMNYFYIEKTSTVRSLEHYLQYNAGFVRDHSP